MNDTLPPRPGIQPRTRKGLPHQQLDQQPHNDTIRVLLAERLFALAGVVEAPSAISVPRARALVLREDAPTGPPDAFLVGREFAHLHPPPDQSLHLTLPVERARQAILAGWAELHPLAEDGQFPATLVMVYAPRDAAELEVVYGLARESYRFALGGSEVATVAGGARRTEAMPN